MKKTLISNILISLTETAAKVTINSACFFMAYQPILLDSVKKMRKI